MFCGGQRPKQSSAFTLYRIGQDPLGFVFITLTQDKRPGLSAGLPSLAASVGVG